MAQIRQYTHALLHICASGGRSKVHSFPYICLQYTNMKQMDSTATALTALFNRIPRRHSLENVKDINSIVTEYENILLNIEAINPFYEKNIPVFFDDLDAIRAAIKKSIDNKASKKNKDSFFDEASGILKDSIQSLLTIYDDGNRTE